MGTDPRSSRCYVNRPFPSSPGPLYQNEVRCSAFDMEMICHSHANKYHFHKKGLAPNLLLIQRPGGTRKWPISFNGKLMGFRIKIFKKQFVCLLFPVRSSITLVENMIAGI